MIDPIDEKVADIARVIYEEARQYSHSADYPKTSGEFLVWLNDKIKAAFEESGYFLTGPEFYNRYKTALAGKLINHPSTKLTVEDIKTAIQKTFAVCDEAAQTAANVNQQKQLEDFVKLIAEHKDIIEPHLNQSGLEFTEEGKAMMAKALEDGMEAAKFFRGEDD